MRQSWDDRELTVSKWTDVARTACNVTGEGGAALDDCSRTVDESFSSPTGRVSINFTPTDSMLAYASFSTGYRAGGFNTRGNNDSTLVPFDEETVRTLEIGFKNDWNFDNATIRSNFALYNQDYADIHYTRSFDVEGVLFTRTENAAEATVRGFEADLTALLGSYVTLGFSYSFVDASFDEREDIIGGVVVDTSDNDFTYIPEQSLTASVNFMLPLPEDIGEVSLFASYYWQDEMKTHALINQFDQFPGSLGGFWTQENVDLMTDYSTIDSYGVANIRLDWRSIMGSTFDAALSVNNATDEEYVLGGLNVIDSGGYGSAIYGAPRTVSASVRYTF